MPNPYKKEEVLKFRKAREVADSIADYLNQLEKIFTEPMNEQQKVEAFNQGALFTGKVLVAFSNLCDLCDIYKERGVRGAIKKKQPAEEEKYEYKEV